MCLMGSTFFDFAQNTIHDFQNTVLNSWWRCLRQMPRKGENEAFTPFPSVSNVFFRIINPLPNDKS